MPKNISDIVEYIKNLKGYKTDEDMAKALGVSVSKLRTAKHRNAPSFHKTLVDYYISQNISLDFLQNYETPIDLEEKNNTLEVNSKGHQPNRNSLKDDGEYRNVVLLEVYSLKRVRGGEASSELMEIHRIGIPDIDYNKNLHCYYYRGHDMASSIRDGSVIVVDHSKLIPVPGEIYLFKYYPDKKNTKAFIHIVRRLDLAEDSNGFDLVPDNPSRKTIRIPSMKRFDEMIIGRITKYYSRLDLLEDLKELSSGK